MTKNTALGRSPYIVKLLDCPSLTDEQHQAAEFRFRMALEASLGGPDYVLPTLQSYMLAQVLNEYDDDAEEDAGDEADKNDEKISSEERSKTISNAHGEGNDEAQVEETVIELWDTAEAEAILAAMRPFGDKLVNAQFKISPVQEPSYREM